MRNEALEQLLNDHIVVMYDGVCGFCNTSVQYVLQQRPMDHLRFVSFQSELGETIRTHLDINEDLDSIIVVDRDKYYKKSKAVFKILNYIQSGWKYLKYFKFIPTPICDFVYSIIAKNRYKIQQNSCPILTIEERKLFILDS